MDPNAVGDRGESIFSSRITFEYKFKVYFLGEKAPVGDFILEINDETTPYECMVQVKATEAGYQPDGRLKAKVSTAKMQELINRPLPAYVAGVDITSETVYIAPAFNDTHNYATSIPVTHKLAQNDSVASRATIAALKQDIIDFWNKSGLSTYKSTFVTAL